MNDDALSSFEGMLAETYDEANSTVRNPSGDRSFYAALADEVNGPVLEIGCGTGRVLLPIAAAGHDVVGVDPSASMLSVLKRRNPTVRVIQATAQALDLPRRDFELVTFPFRSFMHLETVEEQLEALERAHRHLGPGGWLALDVFEPRLDLLSAPIRDSEQRPFTWGDRTITRRAHEERDLPRQITRVRFDFVDVGTGQVLDTASFAMRWTYRFELEHLLHRAGFTPFRWSSDFRGGPYVGTGDIVVVASRR